MHLVDFHLWHSRVTSEAGSGVPETSVQADIIYDNWILDIPKVLDVCVLYGVENQDLVKDFLQKLFFLQPKYLEDLAGVVPLLVENIQKLENRCWDSLPDTRLGHKTVLAGWPGNFCAFQFLLCASFMSTK